MSTTKRKSYKINYKRFWEVKGLLKEFDGNTTTTMGYFRGYFPITKTDIYQVKRCKTYQEYRQLVKNRGVVNKSNLSTNKIEPLGEIVMRTVVFTNDMALCGFQSVENFLVLSKKIDEIINYLNKQK